MKGGHILEIPSFRICGYHGVMLIVNQIPIFHQADMIKIQIPVIIRKIPLGNLTFDISDVSDELCELLDFNVTIVEYLVLGIVLSR